MFLFVFAVHHFNQTLCCTTHKYKLQTLSYSYTCFKISSVLKRNVCLAKECNEKGTSKEKTDIKVNRFFFITLVKHSITKVRRLGCRKMTPCWVCAWDIVWPTRIRPLQHEGFHPPFLTQAPKESRKRGY